MCRVAEGDSNSSRDALIPPFLSWSLAENDEAKERCLCIFIQIWKWLSPMSSLCFHANTLRTNSQRRLKMHMAATAMHNKRIFLHSREWLTEHCLSFSSGKQLIDPEAQICCYSRVKIKYHTARCVSPAWRRLLFCPPSQSLCLISLLSLFQALRRWEHILFYSPLDYIIS